MSFDETLTARPEHPRERPLDYSISGTDQLWDLFKQGSRAIPGERSGWVTAGPELGNLGGAPEILLLGGKFSFRAPLSFSEGGQSFYIARPERPLQRRLSENYLVEGVNVFRRLESGQKVRVAYKDPSGNFVYERVPVASPAEFARELESAAQLYVDYATACFESIDYPPTGDTLIIRPDEVIYRLEQMVENKKVEPKKESLQLVERPDATFEDIGGQDKAVATCRRFAEQLRHPDVFKIQGSKLPRGLLLYGPPGTGKTLLAKAVANTAKAHFLHVQATDVVGQGLVSQAERDTQAIFDTAEKLHADDSRHVIIYVDEGDLILPSHNRHETTASRVGIFAQNMEGIVAKDYLTVAIATNDPKNIDPKILSRMEEMVEVPLPDAVGLSQILKIHLNKLNRRAGRNLVGQFELTEAAHQAYDQSLSGRDIADALDILARERGERQLHKIREAIHAGIVSAQEGTDLDGLIDRIARQIATDPGSIPAEIVLSPITTAELLTIIANAKALIKSRRKGDLGFKH